MENLPEGWIAIMNEIYFPARIESSVCQTTECSEVRNASFLTVLHESKPDFQLESMKDGRHSRRQENWTDDMKDRRQSGMKFVFHREKRPKHRLGKMSDKNLFGRSSGQRSMSHLAK
jgi:hypothetical protein